MKPCHSYLFKPSDMNPNLPHFFARLHDDSLFGGSFDTVKLRESPETSAWSADLEDAWGLILSPHSTTTHPHLQFESRLSTGRGRLFFGQMACCSPPPSFSSPHRQPKRQPATNTRRRRRISASDISRGAIRKGDLLRQICAVEALGER